MEENAKEMILSDALKVAIESTRKLIMCKRIIAIETIIIIGLLVVFLYK